MYEKLRKLGFSQFHMNFAHENDISLARIARVVSCSHENYQIVSAMGHSMAALTGKLRFKAEMSRDLPATGDWVEVGSCTEKESVIHQILPRQNYLARSAVGKRDEQIIAANIESAIIVMAADRDFNLARIDRYLSLINDQGIFPVVFLNKTDLLEVDEVKALENSIYRRHANVTVFCGSVLEEKGLGELMGFLSSGQSFCVVGSSGVGKSSLINYLARQQIERVTQIGDGTNRGRHTTPRGHLYVLENGSILIDTPGLREVGLTNAESGIGATFPEIEELALHCRFADCTHTSEPGCAILAALEQGAILPEKFESFQKLRREAARFGQTIAERRQKEKGFGRMIKEVMKHKKQLKG
jgi:ribosome biogenesis GTPase